MNSGSYRKQIDDEVDLTDILLSIWKSKWIVMSTILIAVCVAAGYAYFRTPTFETSVRLLPPRISDLASYNSAAQLTEGAISGSVDHPLFRLSTTGIAELTPKAAYEAFLQTLTSDALKLKFFNEYYLKDPSGYSDYQKEQLSSALYRQLNIQLPSVPNDVVVTLTWQGVNPQQLSELANAFVALAARITRENLTRDLNSQVDVRLAAIDRQVAALREVAKTLREARIAQLHNALKIAQTIGLDSPPVTGPLVNITAGSRSETVDGTGSDLMYLRGAKALQSELEQLTARTNDDPYISEMADLLKKRALLDSIDLQPKPLSVMTLDRAASSPESPIRPRKLLVLLIGFVAGSILGIFFALIRNIIKRRQ